MDSPYGKVSQVKWDTKQLIDNIEQLNNVERQNDVENLIAKTEYLFGKLMKYPLKCIKSKIRKRQKQRLRIKLNKTKKACNDINELFVETSTKPDSLIVSRDVKQKSNKIRIIKECKRFLQTFELLEQLHLSRSHNFSETYKFSLNLRHLKSIWNCLLKDKLEELTSNEAAIHQQWNEVLFGPPEKTFFNISSDIHDFLRKRLVWDSYINSKYGSSIPIGWIMPPSEVKEQWKPFLLPTNI